MAPITRGAVSPNGFTLSPIPAPALGAAAALGCGHLADAFRRHLEGVLRGVQDYVPVLAYPVTVNVG
ncbi:MAG: hypothetical protein AB7F21_07725 [Desulfuromonadales bacterium]